MQTVLKLARPVISPVIGNLQGLFVGTWKFLVGETTGAYRPELHYMRGPGPKWRAKHGLPPRTRK